MITTPRELLNIPALLLTIYTVQTQNLYLTVSYTNTQLAIPCMFYKKKINSKVKRVMSYDYQKLSVSWTSLICVLRTHYIAKNGTTQLPRIGF